ncbi:histidine phosphatase family protein [Sporosarcina sp. G11-34]|uniref:histidine phosphatase family protein n=1 Tax=Sporosarcina sp. G11-34 TaxID=2849605 RepID=UPI0022A8E939|nr:histidine phosphatase family protein [Sporosarcina sp. G11-34]MCZ2260695.1 histidine phosphatase family protein [Sporosarcina sp. G11-34]
MDSRVSLTLIRHLPTLGNQQRQYIGWTDEAIVDINGTNSKLPWEPKTVYGSDLLRAKESAALYFPEATYKPDWRFRESHFGDWEGKTYDTLKDNKTYRNWIDNPYGHAPPNGESLLETETRVVAAVAALPDDEKNHFVVTHGGPIRLLLTQLSPMKQDFWSWMIPHGSIWRLEWDNINDFKEGKRCTSLSEVPITGNEHT